MTKKQYLFIHFASYLTIIHGIVYWLVKEFMGVQTEYGIRPHWFQTYSQAMHILLSPLLVIAFGMLWKQHIVKFFKARTRKIITGSTLTLTLVVITFSGYFIQVLYEPSLKSLAVISHLGLSGLYILAYIYHHLQNSKN